MAGFITETVTLDDVLRAEPKTIYYGANTCWWTHDPADLCREPRSGLPCDPRGGMLFETDKVDDFLRAATERPEHYGKHGLRTFMAAHNANCHVSATDPRATCFRGWAEYEAVLDAADAAAATGSEAE